MIHEQLPANSLSLSLNRWILRCAMNLFLPFSDNLFFFYPDHRSDIWPPCVSADSALMDPQ
jgi:hypothetical protein